MATTLLLGGDFFFNFLSRHFRLEKPSFQSGVSFSSAVCHFRFNIEIVKAEIMFSCAMPLPVEIQDFRTGSHVVAYDVDFD